MQRMTAAIAAIAIGTLLSAAGAGAADNLKLAIGQRGIWHGAPADLGQRAGIFKKHGLELDILYTDGAGQTLQAVISGSADIGVSVGTFGAFGAYAKGAPIRIIGSESVGEDAYWYVRADSPIKSMADMNGRTIASPRSEHPPTPTCLPSSTITRWMPSRSRPAAARRLSPWS